MKNKLKQIWDWFTTFKFGESFSEKKIKVILIGLILLTAITLFVMWVSQRSVKKYADGFATQTALDSIQKLNDSMVIDNMFRDSLLREDIWRLDRTDSILVFDINKNKKEFELFKIKEYEINQNIINIVGSDDIGSPELQREYANFK